MIDSTHNGTPRRFGIRHLSRMAGWGLAALGALTIAAYAASTNLGEERLIVAVANVRGVPPPERLTRTLAESHSQQLADAIRELSSDRSQLMARLDSLERNVGDITSSITRPTTTPVTPVLPLNPAPINSPSSEMILPPAPAPVATALSSVEEAATPKNEGKTEFGVDLGRANSLEGLRQIWVAVKGKHGGALEGLRPVVTVRDVARTGVELRLVAGPLSNAAAAARLCAGLTGTTCHPTVFDGQRLALR